MSDTPTPPPSASNGSASPSPPPSEMTQLDAYLKNLKDDAAILRYCLGLEGLPGAPPLAKNIIAVASDTESWCHEPNPLTEIGICTFDSRDMREIKQAGPYGENLLKAMYWYHMRIEPNSHLINREPYHSGDPLKNRYGNTRFFTAPEAKRMLTKCFGWAIDKRRPELGNCPVLVLGHALGNDMPKLYNQVGFDLARLGTMVHSIDTQELASTTGYWTGQPVSLKNLVYLMGFQYRDPHTANNDTGMTVVSAVQMVLSSQCKTNQTMSLQQVVDGLEKWSKSTAWNDLGGADKFLKEEAKMNIDDSDPYLGQTVWVYYYWNLGNQNDLIQFLEVLRPYGHS
ncbi:hypothetical protein E8E11_000059, partial [Didymella keratinophila]